MTIWVGLMGLLGAVFSVLASSAVAENPENPQPENIQDSSTIEVIIAKTRNFPGIWNSGNLSAYIAEYDQLDNLGLYYSGGQTVGIEAIRKLYDDTWPTEEKMGKFDIHDVNVRIIAPTVALAHGTFQHRFPDKTVDGNYTLVWVLHQSGEWKIAHEHSARINVGPPVAIE